MTPKEKAQELINQFLLEVQGADRYNYNLEEMNVFIAKQCALITVDEMLSLGILVRNNITDSFYIFWNEVKQHLQP